MKKLNLKDLTQYVEDNIGTFHEKRLDKLKGFNLKEILSRKNPYLFRTKHLLTAQDIIKSFTDASISSGEETIFGNWLEKLAIFINVKVYGGWKSGIKNIDLEFDKDYSRYIVTIKSGPDWGNSSAIAKLKTDFNSAKKTLRTGNSKLNIVAVNGCCYGKENNPDQGDYFKYCGQKFWEFISGDSELYSKLIEPLGHKAKQHNDEFMLIYSSVTNKLTMEFLSSFCNQSDGFINWDKLVRFNSEAPPPKK
jgi:Type II restriction endonuclease EcoO109I